MKFVGCLGCVGCVGRVGCVGAALRAPHAVGARGAGLRARGPRPARRAHAEPPLRHARRVVPALALLRTLLPETPFRALGLAADTPPAVVAEALAGDVVAAGGVRGAVAAVRAAAPVLARGAAPRASLAPVARAAHALAIYWVTRSVVFAIARLSTVLSKSFPIALSITV